MGQSSHRMYDKLRALYKKSSNSACGIIDDHGVLHSQYTDVRRQFKAHFSKLLDGADRSFADVISEDRRYVV
eukprot:6589341-Karenia_brevis.AAC.1